jgi:hypothetical protein
MLEWLGIRWISPNQERKPEVGTSKENKQDKDKMKTGTELHDEQIAE